MQIKFLSEYTVQSTPPVTYKVGKVLICTRASGNHFIARGVAVEEIGKVAKAKVEEKAPVEKKPEPSSVSQADQALPEVTAKKRRGRPPKSL